MAKTRTEMLGIIIMDAVNTLASMPEALFESEVVCKTIIIPPDFSALVDRKIEEAHLEALEIVKAQGGKIYDPTNVPADATMNDIVTDAIETLGLVPEPQAAPAEEPQS